MFECDSPNRQRHAVTRPCAWSSANYRMPADPHNSFFNRNKMLSFSQPNLVVYLPRNSVERSWTQLSKDALDRDIRDLVRSTWDHKCRYCGHTSNKIC